MAIAPEGTICRLNVQFNNLIFTVEDAIALPPVALAVNIMSEVKTPETVRTSYR